MNADITNLFKKTTTHKAFTFASFSPSQSAVQNYVHLIQNIFKNTNFWKRFNEQFTTAAWTAFSKSITVNAVHSKERQCSNSEWILKSAMHDITFIIPAQFELIRLMLPACWPWPWIHSQPSQVENPLAHSGNQMSAMKKKQFLHVNASLQIPNRSHSSTCIIMLPIYTHIHKHTLFLSLSDSFIHTHSHVSGQHTVDTRIYLSGKFIWKSFLLSYTNTHWQPETHTCIQTFPFHP